MERLQLFLHPDLSLWRSHSLPDVGRIARSLEGKPGERVMWQGIEVEVLDVLKDAVKLAVGQLGEVLLSSPALGSALTHRPLVFLKDWARAASFYKG
ncbi:hypothetical protein [Metapseudomonas otitidis]|uniref:hypothetical protein n=1 Tax=Metapseudomonas otitidis TaxID=319939 RepID=UPI0013F643F7|nr:hypothetical protein [Pseudomonas otitidis]